MMNQHKLIINEDELTKKIQDGDKEAFSVLFRTYYSDLCGFLQRFINIPTTCESLIQDLFLYIWMKRKVWHPKGSVQAYLYKAARNRAIDYLRHQKVERKFLDYYKAKREIEWEAYKLDQVHQDSHLVQQIDIELLDAVQKSVSKLPERMKLIFTLSRDEGLSYPEIAEVLDLSVKTVETQMGRAIKSLREQLADYFQDNSK